MRTSPFPLAYSTFPLLPYCTFIGQCTHPRISCSLSAVLFLLPAFTHAYNAICFRSARHSLTLRHVHKSIEYNYESLYKLILITPPLPHSHHSPSLTNQTSWLAPNRQPVSPPGVKPPASSSPPRPHASPRRRLAA